MAAVYEFFNKLIHDASMLDHIPDDLEIGKISNPMLFMYYTSSLALCALALKDKKCADPAKVFGLCRQLALKLVWKINKYADVLPETINKTQVAKLVYGFMTRDELNEINVVPIDDTTFVELKSQTMYDLDECLPILLADTSEKNAKLYGKVWNELLLTRPDLRQIGKTKSARKNV